MLTHSRVPAETHIGLPKCFGFSRFHFENEADVLICKVIAVASNEELLNIPTFSFSQDAEKLYRDGERNVRRAVGQAIGARVTSFDDTDSTMLARWAQVGLAQAGQVAILVHFTAAIEAQPS